ncbi:MAG: formylglycine-generating enzyme family protein [Beijerinckiaceae bacterium]|nr:formylglycine-generating enzyme family protein [Beijerinckiaceae bacterium]
MDFNGHEWIEIVAGFSCLGSDDSDPFASDNEKPLREIYIETFLISRHPTTNAQIFRFYSETGYPLHESWGGPESGRYPSHLSDREAFPATYVSFDLATAYCRWLSEREGKRIALPTEAEWEKAARGADARIWPWGNVFDASRCCSSESGKNDFCSVHDLPDGASPFGVLHMSGGVWEWCSDFHHTDSHATADSYSPMNHTPARQRVVKGGSAFCTKEIVRPACRDWTNSVNQGGSDDGMRIILKVG